MAHVCCTLLVARETAEAELFYCRSSGPLLSVLLAAAHQSSVSIFQEKTVLNTTRNICST